MEQAVLLLVAAGGVIFAFLVILDFVLSTRARDPGRESGRRSDARTGKLDPVRIQQLTAELHRTRSTLLGWLSVLEAFALGDALRATALRAELGDLNTCDITLVGDSNVIATYQVTVAMLRNQSGLGLPPEMAAEVASIRVRLLTALSEQERRLALGEAPVVASSPVHLDLWGPPRPITEVTIRPAAPTSQP